MDRPLGEACLWPMESLGHRQAGPDSPYMGWVRLEQTESGLGSSSSPYTKVGNEEADT